MKKIILLAVFLQSSFTLAADVAPAAPQAVIWGADFRYRHEYISNEAPSAGNSVINQQRIRARLSFKYSLDEASSLEFRLATGSGRNSTNQTLGGNANGANYTILLDRAAFRQTVSENITVVGGRFANPFFLPGESDLVWDADLNFDGIAADTSVNFGSTKLFFVPGFFWVDKNTTTGKTLTISSAQIGAKHKASDTLNINAAIAIHDYAHILDHNGIAATTDNSGNSSVTVATNKQYLYDFRPINAGLEVVCTGGAMPATLSADYVYNPGAISDNRGYLVGLKYGKPKNKGDWAVGYDYRVLQRDAAVGAFAESDSFGGGADGRSHRLAAAYQTGKSLTLALTGFVGKAKIAGDEVAVRRNRIQGDLVFKF